MAALDDLKAALTASATVCAQAAAATAEAALVAAHLADPPDGTERPDRSMTDASAMASTSAAAMAATRDAAQALAALGAKFPDPPAA
jgi:4-amino-4-deoxy-L-arabinose transferase-like glycosyltransferase